MEIFKWLNDQLLRMDWLAALVRLLLEDGLGLDMTSRVGASLHFFIYDVIKIFILLAVLIFSISWVQSYFPPERTRRLLGGMGKGLAGVSVLLCAAVLVALASQVLYAVVLSVGYGCFSLWRRRRRRTRATENICAIK